MPRTKNDDNSTLPANLSYSGSTSAKASLPGMFIQRGSKEIKYRLESFDCLSEQMGVIFLPVWRRACNSFGPSPSFGTLTMITSDYSIRNTNFNNKIANRTIIGALQNEYERLTDQRFRDGQDQKRNKQICNLCCTPSDQGMSCFVRI